MSGDQSVSSGHRGTSDVREGQERDPGLPSAFRFQEYAGCRTSLGPRGALHALAWRKHMQPEICMGGAESGMEAGRPLVARP
jgi:hypothetical protein